MYGDELWSIAGVQTLAVSGSVTDMTDGVINLNIVNPRATSMEQILTSKSFMLNSQTGLFKAI